MSTHKVKAVSYKFIKNVEFFNVIEDDYIEYKINTEDIKLLGFISIGNIQSITMSKEGLLWIDNNSFEYDTTKQKEVFEFIKDTLARIAALNDISSMMNQWYTENQIATK